MRFRPDAGAPGSRAASGRRSAAGGTREAGARIFRGVRKCREDRLASPTVNRHAAASLSGMAGIQGRPPFDDACDCSFVDSGERGGDARSGQDRGDSAGPFSRGPFDRGDMPGFGRVEGAAGGRGKRKAWTERIRTQPDAGRGNLKPPRLAGRIRHRESACNCVVRNRLKGAGRRWSKAGAGALPAIGCRFENMRGPDFLEWRACRAAGAQPKKMDRTRFRCGQNLKRLSRHGRLRSRGDKFLFRQTNEGLATLQRN